MQDLERERVPILGGVAEVFFQLGTCWRNCRKSFFEEVFSKIAFLNFAVITSLNAIFRWAMFKRYVFHTSVYTCQS